MALDGDVAAQFGNHLLDVCQAEAAALDVVAVAGGPAEECLEDAVLC